MEQHQEAYEAKYQALNHELQRLRMSESEMLVLFEASDEYNEELADAFSLYRQKEVLKKHIKYISQLVDKYE